MSTRVFLHGEVVDAASAKISVFDRGFLYGDSVYEVMRTSGGKPVDLELHLERLTRSGLGIALAIPPRSELLAAIDATLREAANPESYIRVVVTRGAGEVGLDTALADKATTLVIVKALSLPPEALYRQGASVQIVDVQRTSRRAVDPAVKSGNYLNSILALAEARGAGADEALMCNAAGHVAEGASSNVFVVKDGAVTTPELAAGLLAGITRQRVIELSTAEGYDVSEGVLWPAAVRDADEVFITSSIRGVLPIAVVDGRALSAAAPGPVTTRIMELYAAHLGRCAA